MSRPTTALVATAASVALATTLSTPAAAQDAGGSGADAPELPTSQPPGGPTGPPPSEPPSGPPPVRSGYAVDVPGAPSTDLPVAVDVPPPPGPPIEPPPGQAPPVEVPPVEESGRRVPSPQASPPRSRDAERTAPSRLPDAASTDATVGAPPPRTAGPTEHVVSAGEHLWSIAAERLASATGRTADQVPAVEVAPYWTQVCMLNEGRLRSGDLDLVYPGELLTLPPA